MNATQKTVHQSRWGFHPISREASKKLRFINGVFAKAQHAAAAWVRWDRKDPKNRILKRRDKDGRKQPVLDAEGKPVLMKEPKYNPLFHTVQAFERKETYWCVPSLYRSTGLGEKVLSWSRIARMPAPTSDAVQELPVTEEEIEQLYQQVKESVA